MPKVTQLLNGNTGIRTQATLLHSPCLSLCAASHALHTVYLGPEDAKSRWPESWSGFNRPASCTDPSSHSNDDPGKEYSIF